MEIGTKEWFDVLNSIVKFPNTFAFYYKKRENIIVVNIIDSKAKVENIRYQDIAPYSLYNSVGGALVTVERIETDVDYYKKFVELRNKWTLESEEN